MSLDQFSNSQLAPEIAHAFTSGELMSLEASQIAAGTVDGLIAEMTDVSEHPIRTGLAWRRERLLLQE